MGNSNSSFLSFLFGLPDDDNDTKSKPGDSAAPESEGLGVQGWCKLTADFAQRDNVLWTREMCESEMRKDTKHIVNNVDLYLHQLHPQDENALKSLVLTKYDNSSQIRGTHPESLEDDSRWTMELSKRVKAELATQGRYVSSDKRLLMNNAILRQSKLNRRLSYDYRGQLGDPNFGDVSNVYGFSGRA